jgi:hypothetical protein
MGSKDLDHRDIRLEDVPLRGSSWHEIEPFALTFEGYEFHGSFEACAEIANARRHSNLTDLRTCLYFEQRRYRHFGEPPIGDELEYIYEILDAIRARVQAGMVD